MALTGLAESRLAVGDGHYHVAHGGSGPPVLLLHGFPETHVCWQAIAPRLAGRFTVVAPDLRGYGASTAPPGGPHGEGYTKREMAAELVELMAGLGHDRFAVVGHDRGARVAYRMALDHPSWVSRVAVVNVVPTLEQFERMAGGPALGYWPWYLLAQPAPFPEELLAAAPEAFLTHVFETWPADPSAIPAESRAAYLAALTTDTIAAMCADYRASFHLDRKHDVADRVAGHRISAPLLVAVGEEEKQLEDAPTVWTRWAEDIAAVRLPGGHFTPEEAPDELRAALVDFLAR
ncbi:MAG TPA: alpha/beta hydrolase [Actinophytocola sp.]|uniref:alpha/beta fold hydrolase n=1 Tax=Actinophytocola sp. TaxID=1872138 RepID=UPI002F93891A